jgi:hypothetical protein
MYREEICALGGTRPVAVPFRCSDCDPSQTNIKWEALGDKRATRCKAHAIKAWRASVFWGPAAEAPSSAAVAALAEALGLARRTFQAEHKASLTSKGFGLILTGSPAMKRSPAPPLKA